MIHFTSRQIVSDLVQSCHQITLSHFKTYRINCHFYESFHFITIHSTCVVFLVVTAAHSRAWQTFVTSEFAVVSFPCSLDAVSREEIIPSLEVKKATTRQSLARSQFKVYAFGRTTFNKLAVNKSFATQISFFLSSMCVIVNVYEVSRFRNNNICKIWRKQQFYRNWLNSSFYPNCLHFPKPLQGIRLKIFI